MLIDEQRLGVTSQLADVPPVHAILGDEVDHAIGGQLGMKVLLAHQKTPDARLKGPFKG